VSEELSEDTLAASADASAEDRPSVRSQYREVCGFLLCLLHEREFTRETPLVWVDLGCGDCEILTAMAGIPADLTRSVRYCGFDRAITDVARGRQEWARRKLEAVELTETAIDGEHDAGGADRHPIDQLAGRAHLVTMTNVVHEIDPWNLPDLFVRSLMLLTRDGYVVAYDMEKLPDDDAWGDPASGKEGELLATTWRHDSIGMAVSPLVTAARGLTPYEAEMDPLRVVSDWAQSSTRGWTMVVGARRLPALPAVNMRYAVEAMRREVRRALRGQLEECDREVDALRLEVQAACDGDAGSVTADDLRRRFAHLLREHYALAKWLDRESGHEGERW
jgi:hypothetical protein